MNIYYSFNNLNYWMFSSLRLSNKVILVSNSVIKIQLYKRLKCFYSAVDNK